LVVLVDGTRPDTSALRAFKRFPPRTAVNLAFTLAFRAAKLRMHEQEQRACESLHNVMIAILCRERQAQLCASFTDAFEIEATLNLFGTVRDALEERRVHLEGARVLGARVVLLERVFHVDHV
jgi:hypothetical protein